MRMLDEKQMPTKQCSRCEVVKELTEFGVDNRRNAPKAVCKVCDRELHRLRYYHPDNQDAVIVQRLKATKRGKSLYAEKKEKGICWACDKPADAGVYCSEHAEERRLKQLSVTANRERICPDCNKERLAPYRKRCDACASVYGEVYRSKQKIWTDKQKDAAYEAYGGYKCACCGETSKAFLTIDHVNNDGAAHRAELSPSNPKSSQPIYRWLKRHGYPPGFQVLCCNCNRGRWMNGGICPHQQKSA